MAGDVEVRTQRVEDFPDGVGLDAADDDVGALGDLPGASVQGVAVDLRRAEESCEGMAALLGAHGGAEVPGVEGARREEPSGEGLSHRPRAQEADRRSESRGFSSSSRRGRGRGLVVGEGGGREGGRLV